MNDRIITLALIASYLLAFFIVLLDVFYLRP